MPAVMRASAVVESAGVPAVAIGGRGFEAMGHALGNVLGIPTVPIVTYPGVIQTDTSAVFSQKTREVIAPMVVDALTRDRGEAEVPEPETEPEMRAVVFRGGLAEVQAEFDARLWSDGLPIVPPTVDRVEQFLRQTHRDGAEVLGVVNPERREATVWNVAVNGVMSGCKPEYMPVLLAIAECVLEPTFRLEDAGSTPGWEPLVLLSGEQVRELDFNCTAGVLRIGRNANATVGRFLRMFMRNLGGLRIAPGALDQGAIASNFNVVLAENDAAAAIAGWSPSRVDYGFKMDETMVNVRSVVSVSPPIYSAGDSAAAHLETLSLMFNNAIAPWTAAYAIANDALFGLAVIGPTVAKALADFGFDSDGVRRYLSDHALLPAGVIESQGRQAGISRFDLHALVKAGQIPDEYGCSDDPARLVRVLPHPERIDVVIAGSDIRNQSRVFINNHVQGMPVAKKVEALPR